MCEKAKERASGWKEKARGREGEGGKEGEREEQEGRQSERGLGEISSLADE